MTAAVCRANGEDYKSKLCGGVGTVEERLGKREARDASSQVEIECDKKISLCAVVEGKLPPGLREFVYAAGRESGALHDHKVGRDGIGGADLARDCVTGD